MWGGGEIFWRIFFSFLSVISSFAYIYFFSFDAPKTARWCHCHQNLWLFILSITGSVRENLFSDIRASRQKEEEEEEENKNCKIIPFCLEKDQKSNDQKIPSLLYEEE